MPIPYIPLGAIAALISSIIAVTLGIIYTVKITKHLKEGHPRLEFHQKLAGTFMAIGLIALVVIVVLIGSDEFKDPKSVIEPVPGPFTDLVQEFTQLPFVDQPYLNTSMLGWMAGFFTIMCLLRWPYQRSPKKTATKIGKSPIEDLSVTSSRHVGPNTAPLSLSNRLLKIFIPILAITSVTALTAANYIENNPPAELTAAKERALSLQDQIHKTIYTNSGNNLPNNKQYSLLLHNPPIPHAENIIEASSTRYGLNGKAVYFKYTPNVSVKPFIGSTSEGRNVNWQMLRWAQAVTYGLKPQATMVYKNGKKAYYEASYDSSGSIVFTPISNITHLDN